MKLRALLLVLSTALLAGTSAIASASKLPGNALTVKEATAQCQTVFVGQLIDLDPVKPGNAHGQLSGLVVYLTRPADGISASRTRQETTARVPLIPSRTGIAGIPVKMVLANDEDAPQVGQKYVFYVNDNKTPGQTGYVALKLSPTGDRGLPNQY